MPDFIKSLEHDQLGEREGWRSRSPRKSLPPLEVLAGSTGARGQEREEGMSPHPRVKPSPGHYEDEAEDKGGWGAAARRSRRQAPSSGSCQMGVVLTQGCLRPGGCAQSGQQGSRPSRSARRAWELDPEQLTMEQGPQGGGRKARQQAARRQN